MNNNRRDFIKKSAGVAAATAAAVSVSALTGCSGADCKQTILKDVQWPVLEGPDTPKLCYWISRNSERVMIDQKQMGIDYAISGGPRMPWTVESLRQMQNQYREYGLTICNLMIGGFDNCIYGKPGRDEEIEMVKQSLVAAGVVGIPVVEWNWYVDRLTEVYVYKEGRGGSGILDADYHRVIGDPKAEMTEVPRARLEEDYYRHIEGTRVKDLSPRPGIDKFTEEQLWDNITYFINAVIPVAEKAGVRMALHPNDPPMAISKGNPQIIRGMDGWKRLLDIAKTPFHGMTFDPGVSRESGLDPVEVMRMMGNQMNHSHWRNVITYEPYNVYDEVFVDLGQNNMFAIMKEYFNIGYNLYIFPEHPQRFSRDDVPGDTMKRPLGGISGEIYQVAYARAMLQAAMSTI